MSQISVDTITDEAGTGAPSFPNGLTGDGSALTGINAHKPVAVTGTTPSLNVGTYNYFDQGTLTGDTTVSFASVPTDARWSYAFKPVTLVGAWDSSALNYLQRFHTLPNESNMTGIFFKPDGLKMYLTGTNEDSIDQYDLSTAWDVSTAAHSQIFYVGTQEGTPEGLFFKPDGTKMYITGTVGDNVHEYDLSTAWDVSSATFLQLFSVRDQDTAPNGLFFKPDGTKMYVLGAVGDTVNEYDLSTAWNISTAVYLQLFDGTAQETFPTSVFFKSDGLKMYVLGKDADNINEYDLSTAWNVTTAVFLQATSVAGVDTSPYGLFFKPDGLKVYLIGAADYVVEYNIGSPTSLTLPAALQNIPSRALAHGTEVMYEFLTDDAGVTVKLIAEEVI